MSEAHAPFGKAPSLDDLAAMAEAAFAGPARRLPQADRRRGLPGRRLPADEVLDELGIEDPFGLTGLYQGVDIGHRDGGGPAAAPR